MGKIACKNCKRETYEVKICENCGFNACSYCNSPYKCKNCGYFYMKKLIYLH